LSAPIESPRRHVTAILVEAGVVTDAQVEAGLARQRETGHRIGECLVELGFVAEEDIAWALSRQLGLSFVDVRGDTLDPALVRAIPESVLRRLQMVPLVRDEDHLVMAAADPTDVEAVHEIERLAARRVECVSATLGAIDRALDEVLGTRHARRAPATPVPGRNYDIVWERSGETFLQFHLTQAARAGARAVHFLQKDGSLHVLHRVGARLVPALQEPGDVMEVLTGRLEALGLPAIDGTTGHGTWSGRIEIQGELRPVSASRLVTAGGGSVTIHLLRASREPARLDALGLEPVDVARLRGLATEPAGVVLVCGPAGSGCRTTLAALFHELHLETRRWIVFARDACRWPVMTGPVDVVTGALTRDWRQIARAHEADGLVLDGGLAGTRVRGVLASATHGRRVLARTDWEDSFALIEWLTRLPAGRVTLARRLRAVIQQRRISGPPGSSGTRTCFEVLFLTDPLRAAIENGESRGMLQELAARDGFRTLGERIRAGIEAGLFDPQDARRAVS
jgi:type II secretory ATPase GspE/PulE/Tfp pilus assembly ATPase PilB-like protein